MPTDRALEVVLEVCPARAFGLARSRGRREKLAQRHGKGIWRGWTVRLEP